MRSFLIAAIVMLLFALPSFAQCANGVCKAPMASSGCAGGSCGQASSGRQAMPVHVRSTHRVFVRTAAAPLRLFRRFR